MTKPAIFTIGLLLVACKGGGAKESLGPPPPERATRVVTLAPSLTDLVVALGGRSTLVGVSNFDDAPDLQLLPRVGGYSDPSAETVIRLTPDLLLCQPSPGNKGAVEAIARSVSVQIFRLESLADVDLAAQRIGHLLGKEGEAVRLVASIGAARQKAREAAKNRSRRIKAVVLFDTNPLIAAGPGSFVHELLEDAGVQNLVDKAPQPYPKVPLETLLMRGPDVVFIAPGMNRQDPLQGVPEELQRFARPLTSTGFLRPGPGVIEALEELGRQADEIAGAHP